VSASAWTNVLLLGATLWRRDHYRPSPRAVWRLGRIALASAGLAAVVGVASWARPMLQAPVADLLALAGSSHGAKEITLLLVVASGGLAYVVLAFLTRAVTVAEVKGLVRRAR